MWLDIREILKKQIQFFSERTFSPTLLVPIAPTETNGLYKPGSMTFFPLVNDSL
jgi:hypothetical protein